MSGLTKAAILRSLGSAILLVLSVSACSVPPWPVPFCGVESCDTCLACPAPTPLPPQGTFSSISVGEGHYCAIVNGGAFFVWVLTIKANWEIAPTSHPSSFVRVQGLSSGVTAIAASDEFTCAVANGAAYCWGSNRSGQLGNGASDSSSSVPSQVSGLSSGVTAISLSAQGYACAVVNGAVQCWGAVPLEGGLMLTPTPALAQGLPSGVTGVATGYYHICALANGGVWCWGDGGNGQLGNGGWLRAQELRPRCKAFPPESAPLRRELRAPARSSMVASSVLVFSMEAIPWWWIPPQFKDGATALPLFHSPLSTIFAPSSTARHSVLAKPVLVSLLESRSTDSPLASLRFRRELGWLLLEAKTVPSWMVMWNVGPPAILPRRVFPLRDFDSIDGTRDSSDSPKKARSNNTSCLGRLRSWRAVAAQALP